MKKNKIPKLGLLLGTYYAASALYGQSKDSSLNLLRPGILESIHPAALPLPNLRQFQVSGYYRFMANYRHLSESYPHQAAHPNNIFIGDDSQIPQLLLNLGGSIAPNTSFGTDLFILTSLVILLMPH